jgi:hypothetical protein
MAIIRCSIHRSRFLTGEYTLVYFAPGDDLTKAYLYSYMATVPGNHTCYFGRAQRTGSLRGSTPQNQRRSDFLAIPFLCGHQLTAYLTAEGTRSGHTVQVENNFDGIVVVLNDTGHVLCPNPFSLT